MPDFKDFKHVIISKPLILPLFSVSLILLVTIVLEVIIPLVLVPQQVELFCICSSKWTTLFPIIDNPLEFHASIHCTLRTFGKANTYLTRALETPTYGPSSSNNHLGAVMNGSHRLLCLFLRMLAQPNILIGSCSVGTIRYLATEFDELMVLFSLLQLLRCWTLRMPCSYHDIDSELYAFFVQSKHFIHKKIYYYFILNIQFGIVNSCLMIRDSSWRTVHNMTSKKIICSILSI